MTTFDPKKPLKRPSTPPNTTWFEFLLDEELLEKHLSKESPDPSAGQLIAQFLYQADAAVNTARETREKEKLKNGGESDGDAAQFDLDPKKAKALRILALKVAAILNWDLDALEKGIPLPMVHAVLLELLRITTPNDKHGMNHSQADMAELPDYNLFAIQLFHRWCIRTAIKDSFPVKQSKVMTVHIPGVMDPNLIAAGAKEQVLKAVRDNVQESFSQLEKLLAVVHSVRRPLVKCFQMLNERTDVASHDWNASLVIPEDEVKCQVTYDLGSCYFFQQQIEKAGGMFKQCRDLANKLGDKGKTLVNINRLEGYCQACGCVAPSPDDLFSRTQAALASNSKVLVVCLKQDNNRHVLSLDYRLSLEEELKARNNGNKELIDQVQMLNAVRRLQDGSTIPSTFLASLVKMPAESLDFLLQALNEATKSGTPDAKTGVKHFVRYMYQALKKDHPTRIKLSDLLTSDENKDLQYLDVDANFHKELDEKVKLADAGKTPLEEERKLLHSYDPTEIRSLVKTLLTRLGKHNVMHLSDRWIIPKEIYVAFGQLQKTAKQMEQVLTRILIAKGQICYRSKQYDKSRSLLLAADGVIHPMSYPISRMIRAEVLFVDLLQYYSSTGSTVQDLSKRVKTCINSIPVMDKEYVPRNEILMSCAGYLLNSQEFDYIGSLPPVNNGYIQIAKLISQVCKELPMVKNARKPARDLWDAILAIFTSSQQQKRTNTGAQSTVMRDSNLGILSQRNFISFLNKLKEPVVISVFISCLTKIYHMLKDDISSEISSDYSILWPSALGSVSSLNLSTVGEAMVAIMDHALQQNPSQPSWLRTQADINFAHNQYSQALKYYLQAGVVATDFFSEPITKNVYDEQVYKRMIKCCSYMQCHTQVAVLCQFLDEADYMTAFKALQERSTHDAMDTYYDCIWDVTILEYLINLHTKRGELDRKQMLVKLIGQLELNSSNPQEILNEAAKIRKSRFLRTMAKQCF